MLTCAHRVILELFRQDKSPLGRASVEVDWEPAREWTRFCGVRRGRLPLADPARSASVHPLWHSEWGAPYLTGFRVAIGANGDGEFSQDFPITFFGALARQASSYFIKEGKLKEGDLFRYHALAYPFRAEPRAEDTVEYQEEEPVIYYRESALTGFLAKAVPEGTVDVQDMPVFVRQQVFREVASLTLAAGSCETGGILIGHLHRDTSLPEIFAEVTAQIAARGVGESTRFTFTPDIWTAMQAAIELRNRQEIYLGYWHSHPVRSWCQAKECSIEKQRTCVYLKDFFSEDDQAVLRTAFPRAYSVGLVCSDAPLGGPVFSMFGWRGGFIEPRGFYIQGDAHA
jgi:hypothetical protein